MTSDAYLRYPHVHDELLAFTAEDDVWLAPLAGGRAWRMSADRVPVAGPRFSPDGTMIAWTSWLEGTPEVYVAPAAGGASTRLTRWGHASTRVRGWTPDGHVLATTAAGQPSRRRPWAHAIPADGEPPRRLPYGPVSGVAWGPRGAVLLTSNHAYEPSWWKRYRGGWAGKLWLDASGDGTFQRLFGDVTAQLWSGMWVGERIVFLSDLHGTGNLYSGAADGSDLRQHTQHDGFYARQATTDGRRVVYGRAGDVWLLDDLDDERRPLDVQLGGPRSGRQAYPVAVKSSIGEFAVDPTGRGSVLETRGAVHWLAHRDGPAIALSVEPGVRARLPQLLGDEQAIWVSDATGDDALEIGTLAGGGPRRLASGELGRVLELAVSPDAKTAAVATHDGRLVLVDIETGATRTVDRCQDGDVSGLAFSPDAAWLAWSHPGPEPLRHIKATRVDVESELIDVTPLRFIDKDPVFTLDGKHLAFLSIRTFDPVYDAHVFDLSFPTGCRPYLVPLKATTPAPFDPSLRGRPAAAADDQAKDKAGSDPTSTPATTEIDAAGISERAVPVPVRAGKDSRLRAAKAGLLWLREPLLGVLGNSAAGPDDERDRPALERFDLTKRTSEELTDGVDAFEVSGDGTQVVLRDQHALRVQPADRPAKSTDDDAYEVDLDRIRIRVDPAAEWRQMYGEAARLMRDHFWRADMGGTDWADVVARYAPLVDRIGGHDDLVDVLWEVQGELGASHAYVIPPPGEPEPGRRQGLLGADLERDGDVWRVARLLPGESSDPAARCPLAAPGVAVQPGDAIVAVDGRGVDPARGPAPLLAGTAGKPVELAIAPAGDGDQRRVVVVPLADDEPLRYHDWVAGRRAHVHTLSGGRIGYLHVPNMVASGWAQLHRDLRLELAREALVLDVRENSGGHTSELVVEKVARRVVGWALARGYQPMRYPSDAPRGPVVAVVDENAGSDGDIVTAVIKALDIGPVVGTRTWGGVIGIDMRYKLLDGTQVTQPRYSFWLQGPGWGVENYGVDPDIEVVMTPQDHAAGADPQLDEAVRIALAALAERPSAVPPELPPLPS